MAPRVSESPVGTASGDTPSLIPTPVGIGLVQIDPVTRRILGANACFRQLCGYDESELVGVTLDDLNPPQDGFDPVRFNKVLEGGDGLRERPLRCKDGRIA